MTNQTGLTKSLHFISTNNLYLDEDFGVHLFVFTSDDDQHNFSIQDSIEYTTDQIGTGTNTYYIQKDDQGTSTYGGIQSIKLTKNQLFVHLDEKGQKKLKVEFILIDFIVNASELTKLIEMLKKMFERRKLLSIEI